MKVYLGGPINGCTDDEASGWRNAAIELLATRGHQPIDPMVRDYRGREMEPGIAKEIVETDKEDIRNADVLLMNCPKPSVGTSMEILYGYTLGTPVVSVIPEDHTPSPWLVYHSDVVARGSVLDAIREEIL